MTDEAANTAYIALKDIEAGEVETTITVHDRSGQMILNVDLSGQGRVLGIEFLNAEQRLPEIHDAG